MTRRSLVLLFGIYALFDGITTIALGTRRQARQRASLVLFGGVAGIGLGLAVLVWTHAGPERQPLAIALWAVAAGGIVEMAGARRLGAELPSEGWLGAGGAASLALGASIPPRGPREAQAASCCGSARSESSRGVALGTGISTPQQQQASPPDGLRLASRAGPNRRPL